MAEKKFTIPKTFGACADMLFELREKRKVLEAQAAAIEAHEKAIKEHVINTMPKSDTGAKGRHHQISVVTKQVPRVENWDAFYRYVKKNDAFDLLQKRTADAAVAERWEAKKSIPGVVPFTVVSVSLTKV